jgi:hypothetical protein
VRPARPARWVAEAREILLDGEGGDAGPRVVRGQADQAAVDHGDDAVDRHRGLGDVGGEDQLGARTWLYGQVLLVGRELAVERADVEAGARGQAGAAAGGLGDLAGARQEHEDVADGPSSSRRARPRDTAPASSSSATAPWYSSSTGCMRPALVRRAHGAVSSDR